jgi:hypothetical protein
MSTKFRNSHAVRGARRCRLTIQLNRVLGTTDSPAMGTSATVSTSCARCARPFRKDAVVNAAVIFFLPLAPLVLTMVPVGGQPVRGARLSTRVRTDYTCSARVRCQMAPIKVCPWCSNTCYSRPSAWRARRFHATPVRAGALPHPGRRSGLRRGRSRRRGSVARGSGGPADAPVHAQDGRRPAAQHASPIARGPSRRSGCRSCGARGVLPAESEAGPRTRRSPGSSEAGVAGAQLPGPCILARIGGRRRARRTESIPGGAKTRTARRRS